MPNHGYMETLVHDQGSAYTSKNFEQYAKERSIQLNPVAKGNHKANGLAERTIRQVHDAITNWQMANTIIGMN